MKSEGGKPTSLASLQFYATPVHECSYLEERHAATLFADPSARMTNQLYSELSNYGFRRSGNHIYRPHCPGCRACIPVRIPVADFTSSRRQTRCWKKNRDVSVTRTSVSFQDEHYQMYRKYIRSRHRGGGMDQDSPEHYMSFINSPWSDVALYEFRLQEKLLAVSVTDHLQHGLSAVYAYFDPELEARSLGIYMILWQIEQARKLEKQYVYLGYWIKECRKMAYKDQFKPFEIFDGNQWQICQDQ